MTLAKDVWPWHLANIGPASIVGPTIASAATIAPTHPIHPVSGTAAIVTITVPDPAFEGVLILIATGIWTWTAAGNIAVLGTMTAALKHLMLVYDRTAGKWYPDKVA